MHILFAHRTSKRHTHTHTTVHADNTAVTQSPTTKNNNCTPEAHTRVWFECYMHGGARTANADDDDDGWTWTTTCVLLLLRFLLTGVALSGWVSRVPLLCDDKRMVTKKTIMIAMMTTDRFELWCVERAYIPLSFVPNTPNDWWSGLPFSL